VSVGTACIFKTRFSGCIGAVWMISSTQSQEQLLNRNKLFSKKFSIFGVICTTSLTPKSNGKSYILFSVSKISNCKNNHRLIIPHFRNLNNNYKKEIPKK